MTEENMWAFQLTGPRTFERVLVPPPRIDSLKAGEVLIRMEAGSVCGSDLPIYRGRDSLERPDGNRLGANLPGYPLHEVAGIVVETRDPSLRVGQRVIGWSTHHAGLAEYAVSQGDAVYPYSDELTPLQAVQLQTLACVLDTVERLPDPKSTRRVAVLGLGPIGLLFSRILKERGAGFVEGVDRLDRSDVAVNFGIDSCVHSSVDRWEKNLTEEERPDLLVEVIGHDPEMLTVSIDAVAPNGYVFCFGVPDVPVYPIPMNTMLRKNITLASGFVLDRRRWLAEAERLVLSRPEILGGYATDTFAAAEAGKAFETACTARSGRVKVLLDFGR